MKTKSGLSSNIKQFGLILIIAIIILILRSENFHVPAIILRFVTGFSLGLLLYTVVSGIYTHLIFYAQALVAKPGEIDPLAPKGSKDGGVVIDQALRDKHAYWIDPLVKIKFLCTPNSSRRLFIIMAAVGLSLLCGLGGIGMIDFSQFSVTRYIATLISFGLTIVINILVIKGWGL